MVMFFYRRVVIILEMDVLKPAEDVAGRIGDPIPYTEGKSSKHISSYLLLTEYLMFVLKRYSVNIP